jgi:Methyltransferase domain
VSDAAGTGRGLDDATLLAEHRRLLAERPDLRAVFSEWYGRMLAATGGRRPVVEIGAGPGFFKAVAPHVIAADVIAGSRLDVQCDAAALPFRTGRVGAIVMVDVLHCLPRPLAFLGEAARVLHPGGRLIMMETWMTPLSFLMYRYLHHVECRMDVDLAAPFGTTSKAALWGNTAIASVLMRRLAALAPALRAVSVQPFLALPYLATLGFRGRRPTRPAVLRAAQRIESALRPVRGLMATRALIVLEAAPPR